MCISQICQLARRNAEIDYSDSNGVADFNRRSDLIRSYLATIMTPHKQLQLLADQHAKSWAAFYYLETNIMQVSTHVHDAAIGVVTEIAESESLDAIPAQWLLRDLTNKHA